MARAHKRSKIFRLLTFTLIMGGASAFFLWLLVLSGGVQPIGGLQYRVSAVVSDSGAQMVPGARVTMAGVQVGEVDGVARDGADAVISMTIDHSGVTPLPSNTRALVRTRTPLGEDYLELAPGNAKTTLKSGSTIKLAQDEMSVDVDQVLSVLQGSARDRARQLIQSLGGALAGRGDELNSLVGQAGNTLQDGSILSDALVNGRQQISQLVLQTGELTAGIGTEGAEIRELADGGLTTFQAIEARDASLSRLIKVLPGTLSAVKVTSGKLQSVTGTAAPVLYDLADTLNEAQPVAKLLAPASSQLHEVLNDLSSASGPLKTTLASLRTVAPSAVRTLPEVRNLVCQVNPMLRYISPYSKDVLAILTGLGSASNTYDNTSHTILLSPAVDDDSVVGQSSSASTGIQTLLHSGFIGKLNGLTYDPYPAPGQANDTSADLPEVTGPADVKAATGYSYPHITPSC